MSRARKTAANLFIAGYLICCLIDAPPVVSPSHARLKAALDPLLDVTGLWQESWRLFAPEPQKRNVRVSAQFYFADGSTLRWDSPHWAELNLFEKFFSVRRMKYYDLLTEDANRPAWRTFALYRLSQLPDAARRRVTRVELWRHWSITPRPEESWTPVGGPVELGEQEVFFTLERR